MSVRRRIAFVTALGAAVLVIGLGAAAYVAELNDLRGGVDTDLRDRAAAIAAEISSTGQVPSLDRPRFGAAVAYAQVVSADGTIVPLAPGTPALPTDERVLAVAAGRHDRFYWSESVSDVHLRILTIPLRPGTALQVARPVDEIDFHAFRLGLQLVLLSAAGLAMAAVLGRIVSRSALRPVEQLTAAAESVARTRDLTHRIEVGRDQELGRLAEAFNEMIEALDGAQHTQQRLVVDASHEMQTPIAVLRSNLDLLGRAMHDPRLDAGALVEEMSAELAMMSHLVENLVELARPAVPLSERIPVDVGGVVADLVGGLTERRPDVAFTVDLSTCEIVADPDRVVVALSNVLDNAATWCGKGGSVVVSVEPGCLRVRDSGPGIDVDDIPHVFAAFYRSPAARALPGSGLGLAILRKTADEHGWSIDVRMPDEGGTEVVVRFDSTTRRVGVRR